MPDSTQFTIGAEAICTGGTCGWIISAGRLIKQEIQDLPPWTLIVHTDSPQPARRPVVLEPDPEPRRSTTFLAPGLLVRSQAHISRAEYFTKDLARPAPTDSDTAGEDLGDGVAPSPLFTEIAGTDLDRVAGADPICHAICRCSWHRSAPFLDLPA